MGSRSTSRAACRVSVSLVDGRGRKLFFIPGTAETLVAFALPGTLFHPFFAQL